MSFLKKGKEVEKEFANFIEHFGDVKEANTNQDIYEHWDVALYDTKFDVKGLRKKNRHDEEYDENIHWVELKNVNGSDGWLYGQSDFIVFETFDYWIVVNRQKLIKLIEIKCTDRERFYTEPMLYKFYRRSNRRDTITLVKTVDLCKNSHIILSKDITEYSPKQLKTISEKLNKVKKIAPVNI
jgi:hypothetical protein